MYCKLQVIRQFLVLPLMFFSHAHFDLVGDLITGQYKIRTADWGMWSLFLLLYDRYFHDNLPKKTLYT